MTLSVKRRPKARDDLLDIWSYVADESESAADRLLDRIEDVLAMLADNPEAGRLRSDLGENLRSFPVGTYGLYYRIIDDALVLTRVVSGYRDLAGMDFE